MTTDDAAESPSSQLADMMAAAINLAAGGFSSARAVGIHMRPSDQRRYGVWTSS